MIISEKHKFIILSINKTGTTSMDLALENWWDESLYRNRLLKDPKFIKNKNLAVKIQQKKWNGIQKLKHAHAEWLKMRFDTLSPDLKWSEYFKFCFVRDPIDRLYSIYNYHSEKLTKKYPEAKNAGSFINWLKMGGTGAARVSMCSFVQDQAGQKIVDFVGKYETLQSSWEEAFRHMNLEAPTLPHSEKTRTMHSPTYSKISLEEIEYISEQKIWRNDIDYFGYANHVKEKIISARS